jgi:hypothetical protein
MREMIVVLLEQIERRAVELDDAHATIVRLQQRVAALETSIEDCARKYNDMLVLQTRAKVRPQE